MPEPPAYDEDADYRLVVAWEVCVYHRPAPESTRASPEAACRSTRPGKSWRVLDLDNPWLDDLELCGHCARGRGSPSPSDLWIRLSEGSPEDFDLPSLGGGGD